MTECSLGRRRGATLWLLAFGVATLATGCLSDDTSQPAQSETAISSSRATVTITPSPDAFSTAATALELEPTSSPNAAATAPQQPLTTPTLMQQPPLTSTTTAPQPPVAFDPATHQITLESAANGFSEPLFVTHAGDGSGRLFVVERAGTIRLLDGTLFLDLRDRVGSEYTEQGLLGLAFHPEFESNGYFYVNYTDLKGNTRIARFTVSVDGRADPASELVLIAQDQPAANHNGGMLAFGPDGYLYIGLGDGGGADDEFGNGQDLGTLLGKLLRIDVDNGEPYAIPQDNPFVTTAGARPEIWAYGMRNPWRFSFDAGTGDLFIGDVGQGAWEEIDRQPADSTGGENYGWPILEGNHCLRDGCDPSGFVLPMAEYDSNNGCSVIGGHVYRGDDFPALVGVYLFGDYCSGRIWSLHPDISGAWQMNELLQLDVLISSFGVDESGELYVTDIGAGVVFRIVLP